MFYTVYKTTNTVNGKIYIGAHRTSDLEDGYVGSGHRFREALKKYGRSAFVKEILFVFDNAEAMSAKESELVTREFVDREDTYNLVPGGSQGDSFYQTRKNITSEMMSAWGKAGRRAVAKRFETDPVFREESRARSRAQMQKVCLSEGFKPFDWTGRAHSAESKRKMSASSVEASKGERNSQHGTVWMWKPGERAQKFKRVDLEVKCAEGWSRGRADPASVVRKPRKSRAKLNPE